jgi:hypothetical protein
VYEVWVTELLLVVVTAQEKHSVATWNNRLSRRSPAKQTALIRNYPPVVVLTAAGVAPLPELWCVLNGLAFTALPVQSVAWPATVAVIVVLLRKPILLR